MSRYRVARLAVDNMGMAIKQGMPPGPAPKASGVKLTRAEMDRRDARVLSMAIAGCSQREIARAVGLTQVRVEQILNRELGRAAARHEWLADHALSIHIARLESLLKACWVKALAGDLKAVDTARKVLESMARVYGIGQGAAVPPADLEFDMDDPHDVDELSRYRRQHHRNGQPG